MVKAIRFTVMILAFSLCHAAGAQAYSIRVEFNTNLRVEPSLDSRIVESATASSVLQVVDSLNRWLKIDRNGRAVWMASWVSHTRVRDSGPSEQAAQVDNCCFVDRQCHSDQDWRDGYWAYQRNECPVGASQPQVSTPPTSTASSQVDNCCFVGRQCHSDQDWRDGYWAHQNGQCGAPASADPTRPLIEGSARFVHRVNGALNWLQRRAPDWYAYVTSGIDKIGQSSLYGISYAKLASHAAHISHSHAFRGEGRTVDYMILCSTLVHEAAHIHDAVAGLSFEGWDAEIRAEQKQLEFYRAVDPYSQYDAITYLKRGLVNEIISMERGWLASQLNREN